MNNLKVIYDFGANNGDDIPYYLKKADLVIAVEANPILVRHIEKRFIDEINEGKLVVLNCVLTKEQFTTNVPFYIHKTNHVLSQFPRPNDCELEFFDTVFLPPRKASEIIKKYGAPFYLKIDIEGYDQAILEDIFSSNIKPEFISAESHNIDVFALLVGKYKSFKLVDGHSVSSQYENHVIKTKLGEENYSFPFHSAGPFGEDIKGTWFTANNFFYLLAEQKLGWKDIHATNTVEPDLDSSLNLNLFGPPKNLRHELVALCPRFLYNILKGIRDCSRTIYKLLKHGN